MSVDIRKLYNYQNPTEVSRQNARWDNRKLLDCVPETIILNWSAPCYRLW